MEDKLTLEFIDVLKDVRKMAIKSYKKDFRIDIRYLNSLNQKFSKILK